MPTEEITPTPEHVEGVTPPSFPEYPCSLGIVVGHQEEPPAYVISGSDGRTLYVLSVNEPSEANVESDILVAALTFAASISAS
jgi:hypothetical protein